MKKLHAIPVYLVITFAFGLLRSILFTLDMVYFVTVVRLNPLQLVLVGTTLEATVFLFEIPTGVMADVYSRRLSTIIGYALMGLGFLVEGSLPVFGVVLLAQVVWGLGWTFTSGAESAWIADEVGEGRVAPVYLRGAQFGQLGGLLGIPISVVLGSQRLNLPILTGGALFLVLAAFLAACMPETGFRAVQAEERRSWHVLFGTLHDGVDLVRTRPLLLTFLAVVLFLGLSSEGYDRLWTAHILANFSFPALGHWSTPAWFGILRAGSMLLTLAATEVARRRLSATGAATLRVLQFLCGLMVASLLVLAILAYWCFGMLRQTAYPLSEGWVNQHIESRVRATVLSMTSQLDSFGQIIGGPIVGAIGTAWGLRAALSTSALILSPTAWLYACLRRQAGCTAEHAETAEGQR